MNPLVLVLDGPDGAGKSRHVDALARALRARGVDARAFHHPAPPADADPVEAALYRELRAYAKHEIELDAPDATLDARLSARGRAPTPLELAVRDAYRRERDYTTRPPRVVDTARPCAEVESELLAWALGCVEQTAGVRA